MYWVASEEPALRNVLLQHPLCTIIKADFCFESLDNLTYKKGFLRLIALSSTTPVLVLSVIVRQFCNIKDKLIDRQRRLRLTLRLYSDRILREGEKAAAF